MSEIVFKAVSPDNHREVIQIPELFRKVYGDTFPVTKVYSSQFWLTHIGNRFINLVAQREGKIIGHVAIEPQAGEPQTGERRVAQVGFALCDPKYRAYLPEMTQKASELISRVAVRQNWRMIYCYHYGDVPDVGGFFHGVLRCVDVAICPSYFPESDLRLRGMRTRRKNDPSGRSNLLITQRVLSDDTDSIELYVPKQHLEICKYLYAPLTLSRTFAAKAGSAPSFVSADSAAVESRIFSRIEVAHYFVKPSLFEKGHYALDAFDSPKMKSVFLFVDMRDPQTPVFCERAEEKGYNFCGILPLQRGQESIIYYKSDQAIVETQTYDSERAQILARYIQGESLPHILPAAAHQNGTATNGTQAIAIEEPRLRVNGAASAY